MRFFCPNIDESNITLSPADALHAVKSLRVRTGEQITVCSGGYDYLCEVAGVKPELQLSLLQKQANSTEPSVRVTLFQVLPKADKFERIIKQATELGVYEIVPLVSARTVVRIGAGEFEAKRARYNKIVQEAAKQSGRGIIPQISELRDFDRAISEMAEYKNPIIFYECGGDRLSGLISPSDSEIAIMSGSEGGFDSREIEQAANAGIKTATLGKRILRCETAPICAISLIMLLTNNI